MPNSDQQSNIKSLEEYKPLISALKDGELNEPELSQVLEAMDQREDLRRYWTNLHITSLNNFNPLTGTARFSKEALNSESESVSAGQLYQTSVSRALLSAQQIRSKLNLDETQPTLRSDHEGGESKASTKFLGVIPLFSSSRSVSASSGSVQAGVSEKNDLQTDRAEYLGLRNFAIAASVMFMVTFAWLGSDQNIRQSVVAKVSGTPERSQSDQQQLALESVQDRYLPQGSVLVSNSINNSIATGAAIRPKSTHLTHQKIQEYLRFHAEHASLNTNMGMLPFARMKSVTSDSQL